MKYIFLVMIFFCGWAQAYQYKILTVPEGATVKNIMTNELIGTTPVSVEVNNTEAGSTFGLSYYRHENVAIKIFTVMPSAENGYAISGPDVATMSLPGKAPLNVKNDSNSSSVFIDMRPFMSEPAKVSH